MQGFDVLYSYTYVVPVLASAYYAYAYAYAYVASEDQSRQVQLDSLQDLAQKQERNSRRTEEAGSPLIHLLVRLQCSSTIP